MYNLPEFYYFLTEADGRCRTVINGVVTSLNKLVPLPQTPDGWQDILILWQRAELGYLTVRNFSIALGFVEVAAKILRNDFYKFNLDRELYLQIYQLYVEVNDATFSVRHLFLYKGQLDFSTTMDKQGEERVEVNIMEGGLIKKLNAQKSTKFTIPYDEDSDLLFNDGIELHKKVTWTVPPDIEVEKNLFSEFALPTYKKGEDGIAAGIAIFDQQFEEVADHFDYLSTSQNFLLSESKNFTVPVPITLSGQINVVGTLGDLSGGQLQIRALKADGSWAGDLGQPFANGLRRGPSQFANMVEGEAYTFYLDDMVCTLSPGDEVFFIGTMFNPSGAENFKIKFAEGTEIFAKFQTRQVPSYTKIFRPEILGRKIIKAITGNGDDFLSLRLALSTIFFTSGTGIRNLPGANIITSWADFCKANDVYLFGSYGVQNKKARFEDRLFCFDTGTIIPLGNCYNPEITPATDFMGSSIKIGHQEQQLSDANSRYDFNGFHVYTTPEGVVADKEIDLQSPYYAGPYEIEEIRINLNGKDTTSDSTDNRVYAVDVVRNADSLIVTDETATFNAALGAVIIDSTTKLAAGQKIMIESALNTGNYTIKYIVPFAGVALAVYLNEPVLDEALVPATITILTGAIYYFDRSETVTSGVPSPETIFNVRLRCSALFEKHMRWIRSWLYNYEPGVVKFETANINPNLVVNGIKDNRSFNISEMGARIFLPYRVLSQPMTPVNIVRTLDDFPNAAFSKVIDNNLYTGFFWKGGIAPNTLKTQEYQILLSADSDVTKLIK